MFYQVDMLSQHYPFQCITNRVLREAPAALPIWNPYSFCGSPLLADPQAQVAYPPALFYRWLPFPAAFNLFIAVHSVLAAIGMACFLRFHGIGNAGTALGSLGYALSSQTFMQAVTVPVMASLAWLPWLAWAASRLAVSCTHSSAGLLALLVTWQILGGWPQSLIYSVVLILVLSVALNRSTSWTIAAGMGAFLVGIAGAGIVAGPLSEYLPATSRLHGLSRIMLDQDSMRWGTFTGYLAPMHVLGTDPGKAAGSRGLWSSFHFLGTLMIPLALAGLSDPGIRRQQRAALWLIFLGTVLAWGPRLPVFGGWLHSFPPLSLVRRSAFWLVLSDFSIAWMGAAGLELATGRTSDGRRRAEVIFAAVAGGCALLMFTPTGIKIIGYPTFILSAFTVVLWRYGSRSARRGYGVPAGVVAFTFIELLVAGFAAQPFLPGMWLMESGATERFLAGRHDERHSPSRVHVFGGSIGIATGSGDTLRDAARSLRGSLQPNQAAAAGLLDASGSNPLQPAIIERAINRIDYETIGTARCERLGKLGVAYVVSAFPLDDMGREIRKVDGEPVIYVLPTCSPIASVEPAGRGMIRSVENTPGTWTIDVEMHAKGTVVVRETALRGWRVHVGGQPARATVGNEGWVETDIPAGVHRVRVMYDPLGTRLGFLVSAWALAAALSWSAIGVSRRFGVARG